ncbi:hypothetical protein Gasu2_29480 [Galdieria sulphuraria]|nr:hypothetical protein Gasu2_29480 [Galdieria sulphuraria]
MEAWRGGIKRKIYSLTGPNSITQLKKNKVYNHESQNEGAQNILPEKQIYYFENTTKHGNFHNMIRLAIQIGKVLEVQVHKIQTIDKKVEIHWIRWTTFLQ